MRRERSCPWDGRDGDRSYEKDEGAEVREMAGVQEIRSQVTPPGRAGAEAPEG